MEWSGSNLGAVWLRNGFQDELAPEKLPVGARAGGWGGRSCGRGARPELRQGWAEMASRQRRDG